MNVELWPSENVSIGAGCLLFHPVSAFVPDNYKLRDDARFLEFLRMQITAYADNPNGVVTVTDCLKIQFLVEEELFDRLSPLFGDIVVTAVRHFISPIEEKEWD